MRIHRIRSKQDAEYIPPLRCQKCGAILQPTKKLILTSYPINLVYDCTKCGTEHYMLVDQVLCTEEDYRRRIREQYQK